MKRAPSYYRTSHHQGTFVSHLLLSRPAVQFGQHATENLSFKLKLKPVARKCSVWRDWQTKDHAARDPNWWDIISSAGGCFESWPKSILMWLNPLSEPTLPWYRKHANCASPLRGTQQNMKEHFDPNITRARPEDTAASCTSADDSES